MRICLYGASSNDILDEYIEVGIELGRVIANAGFGIVFGGGASGMMGAAARGAKSLNGEIIGVAPEFFNVEGVLYDDCTELIITDTMRDRKQKMEELSDAFLMMPGGIGTLDEFFEILTLKQLGRHNKPIGILNTRGYYTDVVEMIEKAAREGFLTYDGLDLFCVSSDPEELTRELYRQFAEKNVLNQHG